MTSRVIVNFALGRCEDKMATNHIQYKFLPGFPDKFTVKLRDQIHCLRQAVWVWWACVIQLYRGEHQWHHITTAYSFQSCGQKAMVQGWNWPTRTVYTAIFIVKVCSLAKEGLPPLTQWSCCSFSHFSFGWPNMSALRQKQLLRLYTLVATVDNLCQCSHHIQRLPWCLPTCIAANHSCCREWQMLTDHAWVPAENRHYTHVHVRESTHPSLVSL